MAAQPTPLSVQDSFEPLRRRLMESRTIDVWFIPLDRDAQSVREHAELLSVEEAMRAARLIHAQHRRRWTVARGTLRSLLGGYTATAARALQFSYGEHGKPRVSECPELHFNLSHSGGLALLAVTRIAALGVDVEDCGRRLHDRDAVVRRFFSASEQQAYARLPAGARRAGFFNGWTRKEAYIKALGSGLTTPLSSFDVSLTPGHDPCLQRITGGTHAARDWSLFHLQADPDYVGALAIRGGGRCNVVELRPGVGAAWDGGAA